MQPRVTPPNPLLLAKSLVPRKTHQIELYVYCIGTHPNVVCKLCSNATDSSPRIHINQDI